MNIVLIVALLITIIGLFIKLRDPVAVFKIDNFGNEEITDKGVYLFDGVNRNWLLLFNDKAYWFNSFSDALEHRKTCFDPFFAIYKSEVTCRSGKVESIINTNWDGLKSNLSHKIDYLKG